MKPKDFNEYLHGFPSEIQEKLKELRNVIRKAAPEAEELISYSMPAFKLNGILVYFAAYSGHIGFYPTPSAIVAFKVQLVNFKTAKGSIQFPLNQPLPKGIIEDIVKFRVLENKGK